ncbi:MAG TPA: energy-coupling factor transporter transmembrane component T [Anaerolineaceae bacterium]|nr:energy-coupling factor transporter transmembrane component T [Anaerolineaceae bacterium]
MPIEYQKGNSVLHRLDARTKLFMFIAVTVATIVIADPILLCLLFFSVYYLGTRAIDRTMLNKNLRALVVIFLTFSMFQIIFFTPKDAHFLFYLIPGTKLVPVTIEGIVRGVAVFFRFFSVVLAVHLMLYTTPPVELALTVTERGRRKFDLSDLAVPLVIALIMVVSLLPVLMDSTATFLQLNQLYRNLLIIAACVAASFLVSRLVGRGLPPEMGLALTLGFSTVGLLTKQTQKITDAQKARGYDVKPKNLVRRVQVLTAMLIPIFLATLERSQDISIAILSRGFDYNVTKRTFRREFKFKRMDYIFMAALVAIILAGMLLNHFHIGNFTEQFILGLVR